MSWPLSLPRQCHWCAGHDALLLAVAQAVEAILPETPPPPAPQCTGCTPRVRVQEVCSRTVPHTSKFASLCIWCCQACRLQGWVLDYVADLASLRLVPAIARPVCMKPRCIWSRARKLAECHAAEVRLNDSML